MTILSERKDGSLRASGAAAIERAIAGQGAVRENDPLILVRRIVGELGRREMTRRGRFRAWGSYEKGRSS
ncbi:helix-turn-helix domain-containing protein [Ensifer adhaerens]|uniref:helix-turn-helix domain-containing protein n=1 Tax=Ensifer adhaerens TaxID=106592 RepID=UPI001F3E2AAC|nr:helix-turn-helix domain-containing protein [Ensifer adhaerens]